MYEAWTEKLGLIEKVTFLIIFLFSISLYYAGSWSTKQSPVSFFFITIWVFRSAPQTHMWHFSAHTICWSPLFIKCAWINFFLTKKSSCNTFVTLYNSNRLSHLKFFQTYMLKLLCFKLKIVFFASRTQCFRGIYWPSQQQHQLEQMHPAALQKDPVLETQQDPQTLNTTGWPPLPEAGVGWLFFGGNVNSSLIGQESSHQNWQFTT